MYFPLGTSGDIVALLIARKLFWSYFWSGSFDLIDESGELPNKLVIYDLINSNIVDRFIKFHLRHYSLVNPYLPFLLYSSFHFYEGVFIEFGGLWAQQSNRYFLAEFFVRYEGIDWINPTLETVIEGKMIRILGELTELLASQFYFLKTVRAENMVNFLATPLLKRVFYSWDLNSN